MTVADAAGNRKPAKPFDGIVSAIMACGIASTDEGPQVYKGAGVAWL